MSNRQKNCKLRRVRAYPELAAKLVRKMLCGGMYALPGGVHPPAHTFFLQAPRELVLLRECVFFLNGHELDAIGREFAVSGLEIGENDDMWGRVKLLTGLIFVA